MEKEREDGSPHVLQRVPHPGGLRLAMKATVGTRRLSFAEIVTRLGDNSLPKITLLGEPERGAR